MSYVILNFLTIQNYLKINHWQTNSYPVHVAIGNLYDSLDKLMDKFIEVLQGQTTHIMLPKMGENIEISNKTDKDIKAVLNISIKWIQNELPKIIFRDLGIKMSDDLKNISDEMVGEINRTLFLLTLS
jgi:hypothetical protein